MRNFLLCLLLVTALGFLGYKFSHLNPTQKLSTIPSPAATSSNYPHQAINFQDQTYLFYWQEITRQENLTLIPNFEEKLASEDIMKTYQCEYGSNGQFYSTDRLPLGLLINQGTKLNDFSASKTFNGFLIQYLDGRLEITADPPANPVRFVFQSGPLFRPSQNLHILNDQSARRILIVQTEDNQMLLVALTAKDNAHAGPKLADLPQILRQTYLKISQALNLDGGAASTFWQYQGVTLNELVPIGSFLCGKI